MSSKSTIILTNDNEHWYFDSNEPLTGAPEWKDAITLEFDKKNIRIDGNDEHDLVITLINPNSEIYKLIEGLRGKIK